MQAFEKLGELTTSLQAAQQNTGGASAKVSISREGGKARTKKEGGKASDKKREGGKASDKE